jgi:hypothetical protein
MSGDCVDRARCTPDIYVMPVRSPDAGFEGD